MSMVQASLQQPADVDMGITGALHASTLVGYEFSTFLKPPNKATTRRFIIRPLTAYVGSCLTSNVPRANLWVPEVCRFSECEEMLILAMEVTGSDDRGLLKQAAGSDVEGEPDKLCVRPGQRGGGSGAGSRCKAGLAGGRLVIPDLLR